jgi:excisionase family DNA binding protein
MADLKRVQEAAAQLNVSVKCMWNWVGQSRVAIVRLGRAVRIPQSEIDRLIEEGYQPARKSA